MDGRTSTVIQSLTQALNERNFEKGVVTKSLLLKGNAQSQLFELARERRNEYFPSQEVEVRSVIEISNICQQNCNFCNIHSCSKRKRYVIDYRHFIDIVKHIYSKGRRVLLIQSGECNSQKFIDHVCRCVEGLKQKFNDLTVILCLGNLKYGQYRQLKESGADRYILKFETSNPGLYKRIKPNDSLEKRVACIEGLIDLGFEVGTGNIVGLPNQTLEDLIKDLFFISNFDLTMVSSSVFIPGEDSNYRGKNKGDLDLTLNFMALMRIMYPWMLIPTTSSLERAKKGSQFLGLMSGANSVTIHDGTPEELKEYFPIYSINRFTPNEKHIRDIVSQANLQFSKTGLGGENK